MGVQETGPKRHVRATDVACNSQALAKGNPSRYGLEGPDRLELGPEAKIKSDELKVSLDNNRNMGLS